MNSLASKQGPRYRPAADSTEPYETIGVDKLTPIIGAEISGVDIVGLLAAHPLRHKGDGEGRTAGVMTSGGFA